VSPTSIRLTRRQSSGDVDLAGGQELIVTPRPLRLEVLDVGEPFGAQQLFGQV
jgi:hypothetical protein